MGSQGSREPVTKNKTKIANRLLNHSELVRCQIHKYFFATLTLHLISKNFPQKACSSLVFPMYSTD